MKEYFTLLYPLLRSNGPGFQLFNQRHTLGYLFRSGKNISIWRFGNIGSGRNKKVKDLVV